MALRYKLRHSVPGLAFGPGSSRRHEAVLCWQDARVELRAADMSLLTDAPVSRRERLHDGTTMIAFDSGWTFETASQAALPLTERHRTLSRLERFHPRLVLVVLGCLLGAWALWSWGIGAVVRVGLAMTPPAAIQAVDRANLAMIDATFADPSALEAERHAEITRIFDTVAAASPQAPWAEYRLEFRAMPDAMGPNAFALPGGTVVITDIFAHEVTEDDVIAGVIGHELAHVTQQHALSQLYRSLTSYLVVAIIVGDVGPFLEDALLEGNALLSLSFSRAHETEADRIGQQMAARAGYDPTALARFFEMLEREYGPTGPDFMSTHPAHADRIEALRRFDPDAP